MKYFSVLICLACLLLAACENQDKFKRQIPDMPDIGKLTESASEVAKEVMKHSDLPMSEIKKLRQHEYKVVELPINIPAQEMEDTLNGLGAEGWNCERTEINNAKSKDARILVFCRRRPDTPLRYLSKGVLSDQ